MAGVLRVAVFQCIAERVVEDGPAGRPGGVGRAQQVDLVAAWPTLGGRSRSAPPRGVKNVRLTPNLQEMRSFGGVENDPTWESARVYVRKSLSGPKTGSRLAVPGLGVPIVARAVRESEWGRLANTWTERAAPLGIRDVVVAVAVVRHPHHHHHHPCGFWESFTARS